MHIKFNAIEYDIDLYLRSRLTVVEGNSGEGKTYLANTLRDLQSQRGVIPQVYIIQSHADLVGLSSHDEAAVLVDQMEQYTDSVELLSYLQCNPQKHFLIFLRGQNRIPFGVRNIAHLVVQRQKEIISFRLKYLVEEP